MAAVLVAVVMVAVAAAVAAVPTVEMAAVAEVAALRAPVRIASHVDAVLDGGVHGAQAARQVAHAPLVVEVVVGDARLRDEERQLVALPEGSWGDEAQAGSALGATARERRRRAA